MCLVLSLVILLLSITFFAEFKVFILPLVSLALVLLHLVLIHRNSSASVVSLVGVHVYSDGDSMLVILLKDSVMLFV